MNKKELKQLILDLKNDRDGLSDGYKMDKEWILGHIKNNTDESIKEAWKERLRELLLTIEEKKPEYDNLISDLIKIYNEKYRKNG